MKDFENLREDLYRAVISPAKDGIVKGARQASEQIKQEMKYYTENWRKTVPLTPGVIGFLGGSRYADVLMDDLPRLPGQLTELEYGTLCSVWSYATSKALFSKFFPSEEDGQNEAVEI